MIGEFKEDINITIGKNVRAARNARGWTQARLAERTGKLSRETIGKIESYNATSISVSSLSILADAFGVPIFLFVLRGADWKSICRIPGLVKDLEKSYNDSERSISVKDAEEIEEMSRSVLKKDRRESVLKAKEVAQRIRGLHGSDKDEISSKVNDSVTAGIAMAMEMNPSDPILNSVIATVISV